MTTSPKIACGYARMHPFVVMANGIPTLLGFDIPMPVLKNLATEGLVGVDHVDKAYAFKAEAFPVITSVRTNISVQTVTSMLTFEE
jgi:hypothetical protein